MQNSSLELLNSLLMDAGLLMAVPLFALMQLLFYTLSPLRGWVDIDINELGECSEQIEQQAGSPRSIILTVGGIELKRVPTPERRFRRRSALVIER